MKDVLFLLSSDLDQKEKRFKYRRSTLLSLKNKILQKEDFAYVWSKFLECDVQGDEIYISLISHYFGLSEEDININKYYEFVFEFQGVIIHLPTINSYRLISPIDDPNTTKFVVNIELPANVEFLTELKFEYKNQEAYIFAKEYLTLLKENAPLSKRLKLRYSDEPSYKRYFLYFTKGKKKDKELNRNVEYYEKYIKDYDDFYENQRSVYNERREKGKKELRNFIDNVKPLLDVFFREEDCSVKYNLDWKQFEEELEK